MFRTILEGGIVVIISLFGKRPRYMILDMLSKSSQLRVPKSGFKTQKCRATKLCSYPLWYSFYDSFIEFKCPYHKANYFTVLS